MLRPIKIQIKTKCTALLLILCLVLAGCGKQDAQDTAAQGETTDIFSSYTISPSGVLRNNGNYYLLFYDKESDSTVYLCNRAGCRHIDHDCGAYFENLSNAFFYQDSLYAITMLSPESCEIFRANRYGEDRELLATISMPVLQMEIVGNEFYFFAPIMEEIDDNASHSVGQLLCRLNLDTGDYREFPTIDTGYPNASPGHFTITEDFIYLDYAASNVNISDFFDYQTGELKDITWDDIVYTDLLYRVDRNTEDAELLYTRESKSGNGVSGLSVLEEREHSLILSCSDRIWEYDPQTGAETVLYASADETTQLTEVYPLGEYNMVCDYKNNRFILLKDWQEVRSLSGAEQEVDTFFGKSGDTVYFGRWGKLCAIAYDDLINGVYDFTLIDL